MTVEITLTTAGSDATLFDLYSDVDGFTTPFETNIPVASLLAGFSTAIVPDFTEVVRVQALGDCINYIDIPCTEPTTTTTTTIVV
jgi:hypothetical protein